MTREEFDEAVNDCYSAGYHDGAFPNDAPYSEYFNSIRAALLNHNEQLLEKAGEANKE